MDLGLTNKVALVTASSRGLGRAVALRLAQEGADVALCARGLSGLRATGAEIRRQTSRAALAIPADVSSAADVRSLVDSVLGELGRIDILVANAGGPAPGRFLDLTPEDWEAAADLTLMSAVRLCYAVVPIMRELGGGSVLAITSVTVKHPLPNLALSNSIRMAVVGMVKTMSAELAPYGIRVNSICPGWTRTRRVDQLLLERARRNGTTVQSEEAAIVAGVPLGRMASPEEFANAAAFLVSPAASYITGVCLPVDGGLCEAAL